MSLLRYIDRLKRMDDLIRRKATGSPSQFAERLGISTSQLYCDLKEMRQLGVPLDYCHERQSYFYEKEGRLILDFVEESRVLGGINNLSYLPYSSIIIAAPFNLAS